jgi:cell division protein FtsQ
MSAVIGVRRRLRLRRPRVTLSRRAMRLSILGAVALALILTGAWLLLRSSSFVAVQHVTVTGESGPDAAAIRLALASAARKMTTLDVQTTRLRAAVSRFPEIKGLEVRTAFPHRLVIHVIELLPVAIVKAYGREVPVTGDGTLLPNVHVAGSLPLITLTEPPTGRHLQHGWALAAARLLAAAPPRLLSRIAEAMRVAGHGLVVQVRDGPSIYFGDGTDLRAKWTAAVAVLADHGSAGASYIDVTDPERPVAGAGTATTSATSGTSTAAPAASNTPAAAVISTPATSTGAVATTPTTAPTGG